MQDIYRKIDEIIIHCTDTPKGMDVGVAEIDDWHRQKGWQGCGYHFVVRLDGSVEVGRDLNRAGAHCKDHNPFSIGIAYVGGRNADGETDDTRTPAQKVALRALLVKQFLSALSSVILPARPRVHSVADIPKVE